MSGKVRLDDMTAWRIFATVASTGSMNKAAAELDIDVSSVSRRLERLEEALGYPLLVRGTRRSTLTAEGENVLRQIYPILVLFSTSVEGLAANPFEVRGIIRLMIEPGLLCRVSPWLTEFQDRHPGVFLDIHTITTPEAFPATGWDLALCAKEERHRFPDFIDLGTVRTHICASPGYLRKTGAVRRVADLKTRRVLINGEWVCPLVLYDPESGAAISYEAAMTVRLDSMLGLREMVRRGLGVGIGLPDYLIAEDVERGVLVRIMEPIESMLLPFCVGFPSRAPHARRVTLLADWLAERWRNEMGGLGPEEPVPSSRVCSLG